MNETLKNYIINSKLFTIKDHKKNTILFNEGQICDRIFYVISGTVEIKTYTYNEKEETINIVKEKELFGDILVFTDDPRYLGHGICKTNVKLAYITREDFIKLCKDEQFLSHYLHIICNKSLALRKQNKLLCHKNIRDRILFYLSMKQNELNTNIIELNSINELSNILSLPRPSVSRELINMVNDNIIKKEKNTITLL